MKKYVIAAIGLVAIMTIVGRVSADFGQRSGNESQNENFIDIDADGVCDNWLDEDDDGMNDNCPKNGLRNQYRRGKGFGPGDGSGYSGNGPHDGTGFGPGNGDCPYEN